jgi:hypothetical protein
MSRLVSPIKFVSDRVIRLGLALLALTSVLASMPETAGADTGSIRITITRTQFIVGGGSGTLHFKGGRYPLRVGGVSTGPFGAASVDLVGRAYNMQTAANIHGIYSTIPETGQPGTFRLRNWQGVVLELRGRRGVKPSVDLGGLQIFLR